MVGIKALYYLISLRGFTDNHTKLFIGMGMKQLILLLLLLEVCLVEASLDTNTVCNHPNISIEFIECASLVNLYNITDGDNWFNNSNWGNPDVNSWYGVTAVASTQGHVWFLNLSSNNLNGIIPNNLGELSELVILNLSDNDLYSFIPSEFEDNLRFAYGEPQLQVNSTNT